MSYWANKPLNLSNDNSLSYILDSDTLLLNINKEIENSKLSLDYYMVTSPNDQIKSQLLQFINNNYNNINSNLSLQYSKDLFDYYITRDTLCVLFYPRNKKPTDITTKNMIGFICGHPEIIYIKENDKNSNFKEYKTIDVNYLCLTKSLRNLHVSSYMINILTKECSLTFNKKINCAIYTIGQQVNTKSFSNKSFYHRPINVDNLIDSTLLQLNKDPEALKQVFQKFDWEKSFLNDYDFIYLQKNNLKKNKEKLENTIDQIYDKLMLINKINYDIFDYKSKDDIRKILLNNAFYNFLIVNKQTGKIEDFISLYNLVTKNITNNVSSRNGYFYIFMTTKDDKHKFNLIEYISEYIYKNNLLDMITFMDIMERGFNDTHYKILNGSSKLYYYIYNLKLPRIDSFKNGLITI